MSVCVKVQITSHSHKELPTCVYFPLYTGLKKLLSVLKISFQLHLLFSNIVRLFDFSRVRSPGKGRVLGPSCSEQSGHAGLRPEQSHWRNRVRTKLPHRDVKWFQLTSACRCLCNHMASLYTAKLQAVHHYVTLYTSFIWLTASYPVPLFHHFCLCVHFTFYLHHIQLISCYSYLYFCWQSSRVALS